MPSDLCFVSCCACGFVSYWIGGSWVIGFLNCFVVWLVVRRVGGLRVCGYLGWQVSALVGWQAGGLAACWVGELVGWWVSLVVSW